MTFLPTGPVHVSSFGYDELQRAALGFVLEDEAWPVFLAWLREGHATPAAHLWLMMGPDLNGYRAEWAQRSPDARIRAAAPGKGGDNEH